MYKLIRWLWMSVIEAVYPSLCLICTARCKEDDKLVCPVCFDNFVKIGDEKCFKCALPLNAMLSSSESCFNCANKKLRFDRAVVDYRYTSEIRRLIHRLKFKHQLECLGVLAKIVYECYERELTGKIDMLIPMPVHKKRLRERGFNHSDKLCAELSKMSGVKMENKLVVRVRWTMPQFMLTSKERMKNIKKVFKLTDAGRIHGKTVLIVDDIVTTGASASELAAELKRGGARTVYVIAIAR